MDEASGLIAQIDALVVPPGALALWALGQAGYALKGGDTVIYIDPYLSGLTGKSGDTRRFPPPVLPEQVTNAQVVFCTHEHDDHTDPLTLKALGAASPQAIFVGPATSRDILRHVGIADERIIVPRVYEPVSLAGLRFTAVPSAHYHLEYDPERGHRWLGFLIELNGVRIYHAGDTILYDGLGEQLRPYQVDIACLPVNGRDWYREQQGIIGNLDAREAGQLAAYIGAKVLIPMHNDMFVSNRVNPACLADILDRYHPYQRYHWLQPGELYYYIKT